MIKQRIANVLIALGITPEELAAGIGCTKRRAEKILAGTSTISMEDAFAICEYAKVDINMLTRKAVSA